VSEESNIQAESASKAANPKRKLIYMIIWYGLISIVYCLLVYGVISQPPIDFYRIFEYTFFFAVVLLSSILVSKDLFSKPEVLRSPLWIVLAVLCLASSSIPS
jgi:hypothetical protein